MNARILLSALATKIAAGLSVAVADETAAVYVSTCFDPKYARLLVTKWPAVWVAGQKLMPRDTGRGFSGMARQHCDVQIKVLPVVQRYLETEGGDDAETRLNALYTSIDDALFGWAPAGANLPFTVASSVDGPPYDSVCSVDMIYVTETVYQKGIT